MHLYKWLLSAVILSATACNRSAPVSFNRHIALEGEPNFRDLGAYQTTGDQAVRPGILYRSGSLHNLTAADQEHLTELGIKTVVSFLTESERADHGNDKLPTDIKRVFLPIEGLGSEVDDLILARKTGDFSKIPVDFNYNIHKILPETGKDAYAALFNLLADESNYPIVFHCSHGVHRTGTASALILSALGVPWDTIRNDYMLSRTYRHDQNTRRADQLEQIAKANPDITDQAANKAYIDAFFFLQPEYIDGTQSHILSTYGSYESYLSAAGVQPEELAAVKRILLTD